MLEGALPELPSSTEGTSKRQIHRGKIHRELLYRPLISIRPESSLAFGERITKGCANRKD